MASFSLARNWRHRELSLRLIGAAASIVLCVLWIGDASLWQYLSKLPGFSAIRAVTRFVLVVQFPLCVIIALGLSSSLETLRQHGRIWYILAGMLAAMALAIDQRIDVSRTATFPKEQSKARIQAVVDATPRDAKVLAYSPGPIPQNEVILSHIDAMLAAQRMGIACVNGYSGWAPPGYGFFMARPDCGGLNTWINMSWQVFARKDWRILFQDLRTVGFGPCHLDPALLDIPQSRSLGPLPQSALQARMTLVASRLDKERFRLSVDLKNESQVRWPCWGDFLHTHRICIIGRFEAMDPDSHYQPEPWRVMGELPFDLVPGQTVRLDMDPVTPRNAERLLLRLRLVQTGDQEIPVPNLVIPVPEGL